MLMPPLPSHHRSGLRVCAPRGAECLAWPMSMPLPPPPPRMVWLEQKMPWRQRAGVRVQATVAGLGDHRSRQQHLQAPAVRALAV